MEIEDKIINVCLFRKREILSKSKKDILSFLGKSISKINFSTIFSGESLRLKWYHLKVEKKFSRINFSFKILI